MIQESNLVLGDLDKYPSLDLTVDGADEIDQHFNLIKGGGGCHLQEKLVARNSKRLITIVDYRKKSTYLGQNYKNVKK